MDKQSVLVLFLAFICILTNAVCADCGNCKCFWKDSIMSANCTYRNLSSIPDFGSAGRLIQNLYMSNNSLTEIADDTFAKLPNLTVLYLSYNKISSISPGSFSKLVNLTDLKLNTNNLEGIEPGTFQDLRSLTTLTLGFNKISDIKENAFNNLVKFERLDLTSNLLVSIDNDSFVGVPSLIRIFLEKNLLTKVPNEIFPNVPKLKYLHLKNNRITTIGKYDFARCRSLTYLNLAKNQISSVHDQGFMTEAGIAIRLETLYLEENRLSDIPTTSIRHIHSLRHLILNGNLYRTVPSGAFRGLPSLTVLHFSNNSNLEEIQEGGFSGLQSLDALFMSGNRKLRKIHPYAFKDCINLKNIFLENNALEDLPESLFNWDEVNHIEIGANNFTCSCSLLWLQKSSFSKRSQIQNRIDNIRCNSYTENMSLNILKLDAEKMGCNDNKHDTKSRIIAGLVASGIAACVLFVCLAVVTFRRRIYSKYIHLKYHRQRDDPLFTVDDSRIANKVFSDKVEFRDDDNVNLNA